MSKRTNDDEHGLLERVSNRIKPWQRSDDDDDDDDDNDDDKDKDDEAAAVKEEAVEGRDDDRSEEEEDEEEEEEEEEEEMSALACAFCTRARMAVNSLFSSRRASIVWSLAVSASRACSRIVRKLLASDSSC